MKDCMAQINKLPDNAKKFVVARIDEADCSLWYWGSWDERDRAVQTALAIGGIVVEKGEPNDH